jgi:hypothetical protein
MTVKLLSVEMDNVRVISNGQEEYYTIYPKSKSITFSQLKSIIKEMKGYNFVGVSVDRRGLFLIFSKHKGYSSENSSIASSTSLQSSKA